MSPHPQSPLENSPAFRREYSLPENIESAAITSSLRSSVESAQTASELVERREHMWSSDLSKIQTSSRQDLREQISDSKACLALFQVFRKDFERLTELTASKNEGDSSVAENVQNEVGELRERLRQDLYNFLNRLDDPSSFSALILYWRSSQQLQASFFEPATVFRSDLAEDQCTALSGYILGEVSAGLEGNDYLFGRLVKLAKKLHVGSSCLIELLESTIKTEQANTDVLRMLEKLHHPEVAQLASSFLERTTLPSDQKLQVYKILLRGDVTDNNVICDAVEKISENWILQISSSSTTVSSELSESLFKELYKRYTNPEVKRALENLFQAKYWEEKIKKFRDEGLIDFEDGESFYQTISSQLNALSALQESDWFQQDFARRVLRFGHDLSQNEVLRTLGLKDREALQERLVKSMRGELFSLFRTVEDKQFWDEVIHISEAVDTYEPFRVFAVELLATRASQPAVRASLSYHAIGERRVPFVVFGIPLWDRTEQTPAQEQARQCAARGLVPIE